MDSCIDNTFEWFTGEKIATVTFSQKKWINKLRKYSEDCPNDITIISDNDETIVAHIPVSWFKMSPPRKGREFTEEEKAAAAIRLAKAREKKNGNTSG